MVLSSSLPEPSVIEVVVRRRCGSINAIGRRLTFRKTSLEYRCVGACTAHHANYRRGENARLVYLWDVSVVAH
jgi:hypothetical protein